VGILSGYYQRWQASRRKRDEARAEARLALRNPRHKSTRIRRIRMASSGGEKGFSPYGGSEPSVS
jgi:hypothetical protein